MLKLHKIIQYVPNVFPSMFTSKMIFLTASLSNLRTKKLNLIIMLKNCNWIKLVTSFHVMSEFAW